MEIENELAIWPPHEVFYIESLLSVTRTARQNVGQLQSCLDQLFSGNGVDPDQMLDFVQNIISCAGILSRYFWPASKKRIHQNRAAKLRDSFCITDDNPLKDRKVRNFVEHFDENLDIFLSQLIAGVIVPQHIGYRKRDEQVPPKFFRAYYVDEGVFCSLDMEYELEPIVNEIEQLHQRFRSSRDAGGLL
ncbi:hypothetical protein [Mucilaginibacter rubeus]|uniref:hypothetical protein n=1 Tax=Mucilaginibacter rubeus TaxID=2027860 RepID=UPI00166DC4BE|nr:hypothetical protein [Mucilaginibacter rubeus]GGA95774.1 hypothetical protein GCM10011500_09440 [Mucilaginibacter rubeus]